MSIGMTFEEMEKQLKEGEPTTPAKAEESKLSDSDTIPERLRGKSAAEIAAYTDGLERSLRASEAARDAMKAAQEIKQTPVTPAPTPDPIKPLTRDELKELYEKDPIAAQEYMFDQHNKSIASHLEQRLRPLMEGTYSSAESNARKKYELEFEILGPEIKKAVDMIPNKTVLGNDQSWQELIGYVRGQPGNFEKLFDERVKRAAAKATDTTPRDAYSARDEQRREGGFAPTPTYNPSIAPKGKMDPLKQEIARNLGFESDEEYLKWERFNNG